MNKTVLIAILLTFVAVSFLTLPRNPLLNDDAANYALIVKNAVIYHQWLAQLLTPGDLSSFMDKPPLGIWLLAAPLKLLNLTVNELTIHLPNLIYYVILLLLMFYLLPKRIALHSSLIAATSLALVVYSRAPKLDILLTLFILLAHLCLFSYLNKQKTLLMYLFFIFMAFGFLIKTGFGIIMPGLTFLFLLVFNPHARKQLTDFICSRHSILCILIFLAIITGVLGVQLMVLKEYWIPYLKSITFQSKYNTGYLGLGFNYSIIQFLLIAIFPWSPLFISGIKLNLGRGGRGVRALNLNSFCSLWFWSNFLFLLFFYRQTDFRTFTLLVPPMAILAAHRLSALEIWTKNRGADILWNIFYLLLFLIAFITLIQKPYNPAGINLNAVILPIGLFVAALAVFTFYLLRPIKLFFIATFILVCVSYAALFYNTRPLADAFNPDVTWPKIIRNHRIKGSKFYVYRPPDRNLIMSPDLTYVDFMAGPADKYFWDKEEFMRSLTKEKTIILSDTESWKKLNYKRGGVIAQDNYSVLVLK